MKLEYLLLLAYILVFTVCAISPYDRAVWWAENIPVILIVAFLVLTYHRFQFSALSYLFMTVFIVLHTIGGHYTFERVPFDWITDSFGFSRNHYDRIAHFSVGFYAYPIAEFMLRQNLISKKIPLLLFSVFSIVTVAAGYELIEWQYAIYADAEQGIAMLGSQGDVWDAQKDILADTLGAIFILFWFRFKKREFNS